MQLNFPGKNVYITGGANGIGLAAAKKFRTSGASVFVFDLPGESPQQVAETFGASGIELDVTDPSSVESAFGALPPPDVLVANAGIGPSAPILETSRELWDRTLAINLSGAFYATQFAARRMKERGGSIVLTASTNSFDGEADLVAYNASKSGLLGLLVTAANELGVHGIRVNAVCPGLIRTRLTQRYFDEPEILKPYFQHIPLGRGGEAEEVAAAIVFLASDAASFITGATLFVDGGQMAAKYSIWNEAGAEFQTDRWKLRGR